MVDEITANENLSELSSAGRQRGKVLVLLGPIILLSYFNYWRESEAVNLEV